MYTNTKHINIIATITNRKTVSHLNVNGYAYLNSGFLSGVIKSGTLSERLLLSAFTFTGCPIAANVRTRTLNINPWVWTKGSYSSNRRLVGKKFSASSNLTSIATKNSIDVIINISVTGELPELIGVAKPFQESIEQKEAGALYGKFPITFKDKGGAEVVCEAETLYTLKTKRKSAKKFVFRNITILTSDAVGGGLQQVEQIDLFDNPDKANADLLERAKAI